MPRELGNGIADFVADGAIGFGAEGLEELLADDSGLFLGQRVEHVEILARLDLSCLGGNTAKNDGSKGAGLFWQLLDLRLRGGRMLRDCEAKRAGGAKGGQAGERE